MTINTKGEILPDKNRACSWAVNATAVDTQHIKEVGEIVKNFKEQEVKTQSELLPCPFCGGKAEVVKRDVEPQGDPWYGRKNEIFVLCDGCACSLFDHCFHDGFVDQEAAVKAWNARANPQTVADDKDIKAAREILSKLCRGELDRLRMCVPVQEDDDDMILKRVIDRAATQQDGRAWTREELRKMSDVYEEERAKYLVGTSYYPDNGEAFTGCMTKALIYAGVVKEKK